MSDYRIEEMRREHIEDVLSVEKLSFTIPWSREAFIQEVLYNQLARYLVVIKDDRAVAYGGMWFILDEAHITNIAVHPEYRRKGLGSKLLAAMIRTAEEKGIGQLTLEVRRSNETAIHMYRSFGFEVAGERKGFYYDNGEDALIMWKR